MAFIVSRLKLTVSKTVEDADLSRYPATNWYHNPDLSAVQGVPEKYWKDDGEGNIIEMDAGEKAVIDTGLLESAKSKKQSKIDERTAALIKRGFTYDDHTFSLSDQAQQNIVGLVKPIELGWITFPHKISTNESDDPEYIVETEADFYSIYQQAVGTIKAHMDSGRDLKKLVAACTTVAEVEAIVDPR